jgi:hypothetical protein
VPQSAVVGVDECNGAITTACDKRVSPACSSSVAVSSGTRLPCDVNNPQHRTGRKHASVAPIFKAHGEVLYARRGDDIEADGEVRFLCVNARQEEKSGPILHASESRESLRFLRELAVVADLDIDVGRYRVYLCKIQHRKVNMDAPIRAPWQRRLCEP